jgi:hypothetical protein
MMTKTAIRIGMKQGMMTVKGKGRRMKITTRASATATRTRIDINLAHHFRLSRLIFIVPPVSRLRSRFSCKECTRLVARYVLALFKLSKSDVLAKKKQVVSPLLILMFFCYWQILKEFKGRVTPYFIDNK